MTAPLDTLWTIGHSTRPWEEFVAMLEAAGIQVLADVRRFAGSRRNPQFSRDVMPQALAEAGIRYWPLPAMGGRRKPLPDSPNTAWRVEAFRAYADYLSDPEYIAARATLMATARVERTCVMCAEAVWWRCHRRIIADHLLAAGETVRHIMDGHIDEAHFNAGAQVQDDGTVSYPSAQKALDVPPP